MNKHITKHSQGLDTPIVWCGRTVPGNSGALSIRQAAMTTDKAICQNCIKAVVKSLESKLKTKFEVSINLM
jgi:hypothetical protein